MSLYLNDIMGENDDTNSDLSDHGRFLTKGKTVLLDGKREEKILDKINRKMQKYV